MKLKIEKIENTNNLETERVVFRALEDQQIGNYVTLRTKGLSEDTVSSRPTNVYWFPDKEIKKGDLIYLYTKLDVMTSKVTEDGSVTAHSIYWGSPTLLWSDKNYSLVLLDINEVEYKDQG